MGINISIIPEKERELKPRIVVVGVGGAGGNAVNNMIAADLEGVEFLACNTDAQALAMSKAACKIQLGTGITQGLGAGSRPDVGRAAAEEGLEAILGELDGAHMVFITAGMGGGTGTGGAPVLARAARERGILTVGVVTKPFHFEGAHRMRLAEQGIEELQQYVDTLIIIPNQNLFRVANEKTTFADAFKMADDVLYSGVRGVTDLMVMPGLINLDFADIRTVMSEMGKAMMGTGEAEGERRALDAAEAAISNPLLDDVSMKGARGVLINITGGMDMTLFEVDEAANRIRDEVDPDANIIFGSTFDQALNGRVRVSVVATGIDGAVAQQPKPARLSVVAERPAPARVVPVAAAAAAEPVRAAVRLEPVMVAQGGGEPVGYGLAAAVQPAPASIAVAAPLARAAEAPSMRHAAEPARADQPFLAPRPVEPETAESRPAAVAAADPRKQKKRLGGIFGRAAGSVRAMAEQAPEPAPAIQPRLGGLDPSDRLTMSKSEDDMLEIPAFLRRQAN